MKLTHLSKLTLLAACALASPVFAAAQTAPSSAPAPLADATVADTSPGLIGTNYAELSFGYQHEHSSPSDLKEYEFLSNTSAYRTSDFGVDGNFLYQHTNAGAAGFDDNRDQLELGGTAFLNEIWGKPFVSADAGMAWERVGGVSRKGFVYDLQGGVEFAVLRDLALTPFVGYEALPHLYNHERPDADFPDHTLDFGVKATYRITRDWKASLTLSQDQYSRHDLGLRGGISYRF
jgi:hypothetical protein